MEAERRGIRLNDNQIIELFYERSEQAIIELSKKYGKLCKTVAGSILNNRLDIEECVNDAYLGLWNTIPPQNPNPLKAYVCKVVRNLAVKRYHNNTAAKRNSTYDVSLDELENCFVGVCDIEDEYSLKALSESIDAFLGTLGKENRVIFVRRYWFADPIDGIARRMSMSEHCVTARLFRMRKALKRHLKKEGFMV